MSPISRRLVVLTALAATCMPGVSHGQDRTDPLEQAVQLLDHGQPLEAWELLIATLETRVRQGQWQDDMDRARAEVSALLLHNLSADMRYWSGLASRLTFISERPAETPPAVAFRLAHLHAVALRSTGRPDAALEISRSLGRLSDFRVIGPFDNERGVGFDTAYGPEMSPPAETPIMGKERLVDWRDLPVVSPIGRIFLDEILRPRQHGVAYLERELDSRAAGSVVLRLGTSCSFKVFLNGEVVAARKLDRPRAPDQDRIVLPLKEGPNRLLLKLAVEQDGWSLTARLTDLDGRPLSDPLLSPQPARPLAPEAREILEQDDSSAPALRLLALYHLLLHPDDAAARSARKAALRAVQLDPDHVGGLYLLARASSEYGKSRHEQDVNQRLHALKKVLHREPDHLAALLDLADFSLDDNPLPERADELTARAVLVRPDSWRALRTRGRHLAKQGRQAESTLLRRQADTSRQGQVRPRGRANAAERLVELGRTEDAERLLRESYDNQTVGGPVLAGLADLLADRGQTDELYRLTLDLFDSIPFATSILLRHARLLEYAGAEELATDLVTRCLDLCPEDTTALLQLVRMDVRGGRIPAAVERLDEVIRLDPGNEKARRHRKLLSSEGYDAFHEAYQWDATALAEPYPETASVDEPLEALRRTVVHRVNLDGTEHRYEHAVFRALNLGGVKQLDTWTIRYPAGANLQVFQARVIRQDGSFEPAPAPSASRRRRESGRRFYDLPPLQPGDLVDIEYRIDEKDAGVFGEYFGTRHLFYPDVVDTTAPTRQSELIILAPEEVPLYVASRNAESVKHQRIERPDGLRELRWSVENLPRPGLESAMPSRIEFAPLVDVTTFPDWNAFAIWWWSFIEKEFVTTEAMRQKVRELTAGLDDERSRVEAINRFVAQEIRYNAWPFGTHGYEPYSAAAIFERRFGDCKDKSILLRQMLAEIGVEAIPVLIKAGFRRSDEPLEAAMVGHFNHCIAYVKPTADRGGYYLDATAAHNPVDYLRADDQGARVLHVDASGGSLADIDYVAAADNALVRRYRIELDPQGDGKVELRDDSNGRQGVRLRTLFGGESGDLETNLARELADGFGDVEIESVELSDLEDITTRAWLHTRFSARGIWTQQGGRRTLPLGFDDIGMALVATEAEADRSHDVILDRPFAIESTVEYRLPDGLAVSALPDEVSIQEEGLLEYRQVTTQADGTIEVSRHFSIRAQRVPLDRYGAFRDAMRRVRQAEERTIELRPSREGEDS